jgi:hypothetical protein
MISSQFTLPGEDILDVNFETFSQAALLAVLVEIESKHPGTLAYCVRLMALAADGWHFKATASDAGRSLKIQQELVDLLTDIDKSLENRKEGYHGH